MSDHYDPARVESNVATALRLIQRYDDFRRERAPRQLLMEALNALGRELGLECSGEDEGNGFYDHSGDTCPIHEWLVDADASADSGQQKFGDGAG